MKFKNWLDTIEEASKPATPTTRPPRPSGNAAKPDMTSFRGIPYGWAGTQTPFSKTLDNPAAIAIPAGIGAGVDDDMKKMGREFSPTPRVVDFPHEIEPAMKHGTLPIQLPSYYEQVEDHGTIKTVQRDLFSFRSNSFTSINFQTVSRALGNSDYRDKLRTLDENPDDPYDMRKFLLLTKDTRVYDYRAGEERDVDFNDIEVAKLFTRYCILYLIVEDMLQQDENIRNKYDIMKPTLEYENLNENKNILISVFSFKAINNNVPDSFRGLE